MDIRPTGSDHHYSSEASDLRAPGEFLIPKKVVFGGVSVVVLVFLLFTGQLSRGYESKTISFAGFSRSSHGTGFGSKRLFLRKGQTLAADYETEIERGRLSIRLRKLWAPFNTPPVGQVRVQQSGSGQLRVPVPETGLYQLWIKGWPDGDGYHMSYKVWWRTE